MIKNRLILVFTSLLALVIILGGCKKNNSAKPVTSDNTQGGKYFLSGDINGVPWKANLVYAGDTANLMILAGIRIQNADTSLFLLTFNEGITLNQSNNFNINAYSLAVYLPSTLDISGLYSTSFNNSGQTGEFTVTSLDRTTDIVSGTFTANETNKNSISVLTISNGKFNIPFILDKPPGLPYNIKY